MDKTQKTPQCCYENTVQSAKQMTSIPLDDTHVQRQACFQNNYFILYTEEKEVTFGTGVII